MNIMNGGRRIKFKFNILGIWKYSSEQLIF